MKNIDISADTAIVKRDKNLISPLKFQKSNTVDSSGMLSIVEV